MKKPTLQRHTTKKPTLQRYTTKQPTLEYALLMTSPVSTTYS